MDLSDLKRFDKEKEEIIVESFIRSWWLDDAVTR